MAQLTIDTSQCEIAKKFLTKELAPKIKPEIADAANRAAAGIRTDGTRAITKQYGITRKLVFDSWKVRRSSRNAAEPIAYAVTQSGMVPLYQYKPSPKSVMTGRTRGGVSAMVVGQRVTFKHAFVAKMKSGHVGVFRRRSTRRLDIEELYGLSVPQLAEREEVASVVQAGASKRFEARLLHGIDRLLSQYGAK